MTQIVSYVHHGTRVKVREDLKGRHRELCLCHSCAYLKPGAADNCRKAQRLYELCVAEGMTTPVFECPSFLALNLVIAT